MIPTVTAVRIMTLAAVAALATTTLAFAQSSGAPHLPMASDIGSVAPALDRYGRDTLAEKLWRRPGLSLRDRSIVTVAALIARDQTANLPASLKTTRGTTLVAYALSR